MSQPLAEAIDLTHAMLTAARAGHWLGSGHPREARVLLDTNP